MWRDLLTIHIFFLIFFRLCFRVVGSAYSFNEREKTQWIQVHSVEAHKVWKMTKNKKKKKKKANHWKDNDFWRCACLFLHRPT